MKLTERDELRLTGVHPNLVRVVRRAAALANDTNEFFVLEGVRTREQMLTNWGKGRTEADCRAAGVPVQYAKPNERKVTWLRNPLKSKHALQSDGFGHAVDVAPLPLDWNDLKAFDRVGFLMLRAAQIEGVSIRWGADWNRNGRLREKGETDSPHFELG